MYYTTPTTAFIIIRNILIFYSFLQETCGTYGISGDRRKKKVKGMSINIKIQWPFDEIFFALAWKPSL